MIEPFYIRKTRFVSDKAVACVFNRAEGHGAKLMEGVEGYHNKWTLCFDPQQFSFFGVDEKLNTLFTNSPCYFGDGAVELTLEEVPGFLGAEQPAPEIAGVDRKGREWSKGVVMVKDSRRDDWELDILEEIINVGHIYKFKGRRDIWNLCRELTPDEVVIAKRRSEK